MARHTTDALKEGIEEHVPGVDFVDVEDGTVTFTVMWGGVTDEGRAATLRGMERFSDQYGVGIETASCGPAASTYRVEPDADTFEADVMHDVHLA